MKRETPTKIEIVINVAIVMVAGLLCMVLARNNLSSAPASRVAIQSANLHHQFQPGSRFTTSTIDWTRNRRTLVLALSTTCHFCTESGPFYRKLSKIQGDTQLIAMMPQSVEEGRVYLKRLGVEVNQIVQVSANDLGLSGTPTLVLVDSEGVIIDSWIGKLSSTAETKVLTQID